MVRNDTPQISVIVFILLALYKVNNITKTPNVLGKATQSPMLHPTIKVIDKARKGFTNDFVRFFTSFAEYHQHSIVADKTIRR